MSANINISNVAKTATFSPAFGESVDAIIARELQYKSAKARETSDGMFVGVLNLDTNDIRFVEERVVVQYALTTFLFAHGAQDENGRPKLFSPVTVPFHLAEDGTPTTQLRVFFYRPQAKPDDKRIPASTVMIRCEPVGTVYKFDVDSVYAQQAVTA